MRETSKHMKSVARRLDPRGRPPGRQNRPVRSRLRSAPVPEAAPAALTVATRLGALVSVAAASATIGHAGTASASRCASLRALGPEPKAKKQGSKKKNNNKNGKTGSKKKKTAREEAKDDLKKETAEDRKQAEEQARREAMGATGAGEFKDGLQEDADAFKEGFDDEMPEDPRGCFREWIYSCLGCEPDDELDFDLPDACCGAGLFMPGRGCG